MGRAFLVFGWGRRAKAERIERDREGQPEQPRAEVPAWVWVEGDGLK
jgi:hypothetical protein